MTQAHDNFFGVGLSPNLRRQDSGSPTAVATWQDKLLLHNATQMQALPSLHPSPSMIRAEHEFVYRNYIRRTANTVSTLQDAENPFLSILAPMAAYDTMIKEGVLALSAAHLWRHPEATAEAGERMSTHETLAIRGLKYSLTTTASCNTIDASLIVTALLLCLVEVSLTTCM